MKENLVLCENMESEKSHIYVFWKRWASKQQQQHMKKFHFYIKTAVQYEYKWSI